MIPLFILTNTRNYQIYLENNVDGMKLYTRFKLQLVDYILLKISYKKKKGRSMLH